VGGPISHDERASPAAENCITGADMKGIRFTRSEGELADPLLRPLFDDLVQCEELLSRSDTQFARRAFVRAAFAFNEGFLYWLKGRVLQWLLGKGWQTGTLEISKIGLLGDDLFRPNGQGRIEAEPNRLPFLNYCAFVLRTAAECEDVDPVRLFSDNGWREMQRSLAVRHRITHPKSPEELSLTGEELDSVREAHRWLLNCLVDIINAASKRGKQE
jgi:hypothetical protein